MDNKRCIGEAGRSWAAWLKCGERTMVTDWLVLREGSCSSGLRRATPALPGRGVVCE